MRTILNLLFVLTLAASIDAAILYGIDAEVSARDRAAKRPLTGCIFERNCQ
jgi:hypothetical protein